VFEVGAVILALKKIRGNVKLVPVPEVTMLRIPIMVEENIYWFKISKILHKSMEMKLHWSVILLEGFKSRRKM
jgi:hypothetical protein